MWANQDSEIGSYDSQTSEITWESSVVIFWKALNWRLQKSEIFIDYSCYFFEGLQKQKKQNKTKKLQKQTWMCLPQNFSFSYFSVWIPRIKSSKFHKKTFPLAFMLFSSSALFFVLFCFVCGLYRSSLSYIGPRSSLSVHNTVWNKMFQLPFLSINAPDWLPLSNKIHEQQLWS